MPDTGDHLFDYKGNCIYCSLSKREWYTFKASEGPPCILRPSSKVDILFHRREGQEYSPVAMMSQLRISFEAVKSVLGSGARQALFKACTNVPKKLPDYIEILPPGHKLQALTGTLRHLTVEQEPDGTKQEQVDVVETLATMLSIAGKDWEDAKKAYDNTPLRKVVTKLRRRMEMLKLGKVFELYVSLYGDYLGAQTQLRKERA